MLSKVFAFNYAESKNSVNKSIIKVVHFFIFDQHRVIVKDILIKIRNLSHSFAGKSADSFFNKWYEIVLMKWNLVDDIIRYSNSDILVDSPLHM